MKIRTDFVTNSSSSSFIFEKGADIQEIKKEAEKLFQQLLITDIYYREDMELSQYLLKRLDNYWMRISELNSYAQYKIFDWYRTDRLEQIMDKEPETVKQWSMQAKLDYFHDAILNLSYRIYAEENGTINYDNVLENLWEIYQNCPWCSLNRKQANQNERLKRYEEFMAEYYDELANYCIQLKEEKITSGILLERFFHSDYILYDTMESPWLLSKVLKNTKACLWSCNHMG